MFKKSLFILLFVPALLFAENQQEINKEIHDKLNAIQKQLTGMNTEISNLKKQVNALKQVKKKPGLPKINVKTVPLGDLPYLGDADAKYAIVEFSEYQCPFCKRHFAVTMPSITKDYINTGKIKYYIRDFPLSFHKQAKPAAIAARCVNKHAPSKFWEMHDALFKLSSLNAQTIKGAALEVGAGVSAEDYEACQTDKAIAKAIDRDFSYGAKIKISGTPTFFIGKLKNDQLVDVKIIVGAHPYGKFKAALDPLFK